MNNRTTTALLVVVALLLALDLIVRTSPAAVGQAQIGPAPAVLNGGAVTELAGSISRVWRFWSDGTIDHFQVNGLSSQCTGAIYCGPHVIMGPTCAADVNRNSEVEVNDFLEVLGQWGPCE